MRGQLENNICIMDIIENGHRMMKEEKMENLGLIIALDGLAITIALVSIVWAIRSRR